MADWLSWVRLTIMRLRDQILASLFSTKIFFAQKLGDTTENRKTGVHMKIRQCPQR